MKFRYKIHLAISCPPRTPLSIFMETTDNEWIQFEAYYRTNPVILSIREVKILLTNLCSKTSFQRLPLILILFAHNYSLSKDLCQGIFLEFTDLQKIVDFAEVVYLLPLCSTCWNQLYLTKQDIVELEIHRYLEKWQ